MGAHLAVTGVKGQKISGLDLATIRCEGLSTYTSVDRPVVTDCEHVIADMQNLCLGSLHLSHKLHQNQPQET